ncbi:MAG: isoleucine--tRNA ligase, partial [Candidatus Hadarchaeota archaeon]
MIQPAAKTYDARKAEREIQEWWSTAKIYEKVKELHSNEKPWYFLDGPPYASGSIHLGTAWNKIIKDSILRYKTMCGFNVRRQPGWDCHGLPIEVKVEEKLGVKTKKEIEERIGVENFIKSCKDWALEHVTMMTGQFKKLGVWMDWDKPYITFTNDYIESAWWTVKRAYERNLLRKDLRVIHWCPRCETALAEHEVRGEYYDDRDPSIYVRFRLRDRPNEYLLIWTTTPWTLPADVAVCVHPEHPYAKVQVGEDFYILAEALVGKVMAELELKDYKIVERKKGAEIEGLKYEHPLLEEVPKQQEYIEHRRVICGDHVTLEEGTGCVHTAPGHGEEDFVIGSKYKLPVFSPVGADGKFTADAGKYSGLFVKVADSTITEDLKKKGVLMKHGIVLHSYPHCWRCQTPLIFRATDQWFLIVKEMKPLILERNSRGAKWVPDWVATRYSNGVESVGDWCISRQRYWGIPIPIWVCASCGDIDVVGGLEELQKLSGKQLGELDLHRPGVDAVTTKCQKCGGESRRVPDVLDVWFDSGVASWASLKYPKAEEDFKRLWPSEFITEGEDQVTKWFYSQQVLSVVALEDVPYKNVLMHGFVLDEKGRKMSKSLGNVIDPGEVVEKYGADVLRFYMLSTNPPWEDLKFSRTGIDIVNKMMNVLWNVHVFTTNYMALDMFDPNSVDIGVVRENFSKEDLWLLSRAGNLASETGQAMESLDIHRATRAISNFILEDLSRWYIKLIRERVWVERDDPKKLAAYVALYQTMHMLMRIMAPFTPHVAEYIYRDLVRSVFKDSPESVHMLPWISSDEISVDQGLEEGMEAVREVVEAAARLRQDSGIKLRWPVKSTLIKVSDEATVRKLAGLEKLLQGQLNCKELRLLLPGENMFGLRLKLSEKKLKEKFGGLAPLVAASVERLGVSRVTEAIKHQGFVGLNVSGRKIQVTADAVG